MKKTLHKALAAAILSTAASTAMACASEPYIGEVCMFAGNYCPNYYMQASGQTLPIANYQALFAQIGVTYGGDGRVNFQLPDLRGRAAVGWGTQTPYTSPVNYGQMRGAEAVTLLPANLPPAGVNVAVTLSAIQANGTDTTPAAGDLLAIGNTGGRSPSQQPMYAPPATQGTRVALGGATGTGVLQGGGQPTSTLSPQLGLTACIAVNGLWPPRP